MQSNIKEENLDAKENNFEVPYCCPACCGALQNIQTCILPHHFGHVRRIIVCIPDHVVQKSTSCAEESMDGPPKRASVPDPATSCALEETRRASPQPYGKTKQPYVEEALEATEENLEAKGGFEPAN